MTILDVYDGAMYVSTITGLAHQKGVHIRVGEDMREYAELVASHRTEQPPAPPFDPLRHKFGSEETFWFAGTDDQGDLVFTQAMRYVDLGGETLANYLSQRFLDYPPTSIPIDLGRSRYHPGPSARNIHGRVWYHGDVWIKGGNSAYRGTGLANALARLALVTALMRCSPDFIFGFVPRGHSFKGLGEREGYMHSEPSALHWMRGDKEEMLVGHMVWMSRDDLRHLLTIPPESVMIH